MGADGRGIVEAIGGFASEISGVARLTFDASIAAGCSSSARYSALLGLLTAVRHRADDWGYPRTLPHAYAAPAAASRAAAMPPPPHLPADSSVISHISGG
jgi:hypothetical protein|eukprot:COSAG01_NODE_1074_length_11857_cov_21.092703_12_plen_100_part_00